MKFAMYDMNGRDQLLGVWVWDDERPAEDPELAYADEDARRRAEDMLAEYHPGDDMTWLDVMRYLAEKAHWQFHNRSLPAQTSRSAAELLAEGIPAA